MLTVRTLRILRRYVRTVRDRALRFYIWDTSPSSIARGQLMLILAYVTLTFIPVNKIVFVHEDKRMRRRHNL